MGLFRRKGLSTPTTSSAAEGGAAGQKTERRWWQRWFAFRITMDKVDENIELPAAAERRRWAPLVQRMDGYMVLPDDQLWDKITWGGQGQAKQDTLGSQPGGCCGSLPGKAQVSALVLVVLTFLFALRWFQRQRVTKPELVTVASTKETNLGDAEKVESAPLPPAALVGESGGSGAVAPVLAGVSEDAGDVEERLAGETQASAMVLPSPGVVTSSGGYEHGEAAPLEVSGEGGQAVPPTVTRALSVVTVAAMEEGEGESVPLPPSLVGESGGVGAVVPLVGTSIETWPPAEEWHALSMRRDALQTDSEGARSHEGVAQQSIMDATASVVAVARSESRSVRTENDGAALLEDGQADVQELLSPGSQHDQGHEEYVLRSVGGRGLSVPEEVEAAFPEQPPTLQFVLEAGFDGPGALAPIREETADGVQQPNAEETSLLAFLRQQIAPQMSAHAAEETARREALTGFSRYVASGWKRGSLKEQFLANLADVSGSPSSPAASFAGKALLTRGESTGCLQFLSNLGRGTFGRVDEATRSDFPRHGRFAIKTIDEHADSSTKDCAVVEMAVFARVAKKPHPKVLGALAMDDSRPTMPIALPKAECDLMAVMDNDVYTLGDRLRLVVDLVEAAQHLHGMGIVHRDIKPGNVLVFRSEELGLHGKLADFGFAREIGEMCPGMMGTPGYTAFEGMFSEPVRGATGHDVVAIAMVLVGVCLDKSRRSPNLLTQPGLLTEREEMERNVLLTRSSMGEVVDQELGIIEFEICRRTLEDGSFLGWLTPDKLDQDLKSSETLLGLLPGLLNANPEEREDMDFLLTLTKHLADVNKDVQHQGA